MQFGKKLKAMTITNKTIHIISGVLILGLVIMWRCERKNAIEYTEQKIKLESENETLKTEILKDLDRIKKLKDENKKLIQERDSINVAIDTMSVSQLKDFWADYKRHYLYK